MFHYVYEITNNINGKKYIGKRSCKCPIEKDRYMGSGKILNEAKKKYGIENFSKKIIKICDNEGDAYRNETKEISKVNADTNPMYYNIAFGGKGGVKGINVSDETKEKRRIANSGKNHFRYGKNLTDKHKSKLSEAHKGMKHTKETCIKMSNSRKGRIVTEETRKKISESEKGKEISLDTRKKISESLKGKYTGEKHPNSKKIICTNDLMEFVSIYEASEYYNAQKSHICNCCMGKRKTTSKRSFMYLEDYKYCIENSIDFNLYKKEKYHK